MEGISRILKVCKSFPQMHLSPSLLVSVHLKWSIVIIVWLRNLCSSFPNSSAGCNRGSLLGHSHTANDIHKVLWRCYVSIYYYLLSIIYLLSIYLFWVTCVVEEFGQFSPFRWKFSSISVSSSDEKTLWISCKQQCLIFSCYEKYESWKYSGVSGYSWALGLVRQLNQCGQCF